MHGEPTSKLRHKLWKKSDLLWNPIGYYESFFFTYFQILVCFTFSVLSNMAHMSSTAPKSFQQMMPQMETSCCSPINSLCKSSSSTAYLLDQ